eukprot:TRINITY_DN18753_c0_g1_i4.p1 TRINITY_DN18753_c0_g1~~TRINITY_DN18753_c0_g1_i4.p1  ORF type:complete len:176 (-),score=19.58 TRINITY_DN18753_c0_g1_i4:73-600(-)
MASQVEQPPLTQDATQEFDAAVSESEEKVKPWGRAVSTNANYPNVVLVASDVTFGRRSNCQVQLRHPAISGVHCRLSKEEDVIFLHDLSTNGTFIKSKNGQLQKVGKDKRLLISSGTEVVLIRTADEHISYLVYLDDGTKQEEHGLEKNYDVRNVLGNGAFATVKLCIHKQTGAK